MPTSSGSKDHSIVDALPADVRTAAGDGIERVREAERAARTASRLLAELEPWTAGTASRARRLLQSLDTMYAGPESRLARATREQLTPWLLDEPPLKSALARTVMLVAQAAEIVRVVREVRVLQERLLSLRAKVSDVLPLAWDRLFTCRGLTVEGLDAIVAADELYVMRRTLRRSLRALLSWRRDLRKWIGQETHVAAREVPDTAEESAAAGQAGLEARYELLLRLGAIDRAPLQRRCADAIRSTAHRHVDILAKAADVSLDDPLYRLVNEYATARQHSAALMRDEAEAYRTSIARFQASMISQHADA